MLRGPSGFDPNMTQEGLHFASIMAVSDVDAVTTLDSYVINAQGRQPIAGYGHGEAVNSITLEKVPGMMEVAGIVYVGIVRRLIHWINTDDGLPLHFTEAVYQLIKKYRFEENIPQPTPAMGVPRTARQSSSTDIAKLHPLTQSFVIDGEVYSRGLDVIQVVASLSAAANGITSSNARNAYGAILFGKSISPLMPPSSNTDTELMIRAAEEKSLFGIFHKRKDAFSYLAQRARVVMQTSPSKRTPNVAIIPFGKMSALSSIASERDYYLAGSVGPKRIKNGQPSDIDTGRIIDGDGTVLKKDGVEIREAPMVTNFDTSVEQMSRNLYVGSYELFSPPSTAVFGGGSNGGSGKSYGDGLPWCKRYSPEKDSFTKIEFATLVERCGWFKRIPGSGPDGDEYSEDITKHLWVVDPDVCPPGFVQGNNLDFEGRDADPFFCLDDEGNVQVRERWKRKKTNYIDDIPHYWKYTDIPEEQLRLAASQQAQGPFNPDEPGEWPFTKWNVEKTLRQNDQRRRWNANIARLTPQELDAAFDNNMHEAYIGDAAVGPVNVGQNPAFMDRADALDRFNLLFEYTFGESRRALIDANGAIEGMTLAELAENVDFLLQSPMQEYFMQDVAFIRSGAELGKTFMSNPTLNAGRDNLINEWNWVIQYRAAAIVMNPDLVTVFRNVIYDGMGTGNNSDVMTLQQAKDLANSNYVLQEGAPAIIAVPIPKISKSTGVKMLDNIDPSRTILALSGTIPLGNRENADIRPHYPGYKLCSYLFGWDRLRVISPTPDHRLPIASMLFRGSLTWPTHGGEIVEECHDPHGLGAVGARDVRMYGRSMNPTACD